MKELLIKTLEAFGYPVMLQGSLNEDEAYPPTFITFWTSNADDGTHYDNDAANFIWVFDVFFYSNDPSLVNTKPLEIREALRAKGFIPRGKGWDAPSDESTHTGWGQEYSYRELN